MISDCWQALITDSPRHWNECPLAGWLFWGGKTETGKNFFHAGVILWWNFMAETNQMSFILFMMLSVPRLRFLSHYSCLFGLKQIKNRSKILWYNFDFAYVIWHLNDFREVSFFYLCYLVLFWKMLLLFQRQILYLSVWLEQFWTLYQHLILMANKKTSAYYSDFSSLEDFKDEILKLSPLWGKNCSWSSQLWYILLHFFDIYIFFRPYSKWGNTHGRSSCFFPFEVSISYHACKWQKQVSLLEGC